MLVLTSNQNQFWPKCFLDERTASAPRKMHKVSWLVRNILMESAGNCKLPSALFAAALAACSVPNAIFWSANCQAGGLGKLGHELPGRSTTDQHPERCESTAGNGPRCQNSSQLHGQTKLFTSNFLHKIKIMMHEKWPNTQKLQNYIIFDALYKRR